MRTRKHGAGGAAGVKLGDSAPPPGLFAGLNPFAGVLPGSWSDPFIVLGGTTVPQFLIETFHVPPFLLPIYQAAGSAYDIPWQVLAAINEVETDYGTNLDTSSAGAMGWMQFLRSTWRRYGVDASGTGARDPYNAADAIFAAARYLAAAGGATNLASAIFAYNHSWDYVRSVILRAQLLGGEPVALTDAVAELAEGDFPIQLRYHSSYGPAAAAAASTASAHIAAGATGGLGPAPAPGAVGSTALPRSAAAPPVKIFADRRAAVVAVQDGTIVAIGRSRKLGLYVRLRNGFGDTFTYGNLASVPAWYPTPKGAAGRSLATGLPAQLRPGPRPNGAPATAGSQLHGHPVTRSLFANPVVVAKQQSPRADAPEVVTLNLSSSFTSVSPVFTPIAHFNQAAALQPSSGGAFGQSPLGLPAGPAGAASSRAGSGTALESSGHTAARRERRSHPNSVRRRPSIREFFTGAFGLGPSRLVLAPLRVGSRVLAGTIIGRLSRAARPHLTFSLAPASGHSTIDPRPFLDAWSQLGTLALHRRGLSPSVYGANLHATSDAAVAVMSPIDLARVVLGDARVSLPSCERSAIASGAVDQPVLAAVELLAQHGDYPVISGAWCSSRRGVSSPGAAELRTGSAVALTLAGGHARTSSAMAASAARALRAMRGRLRPQISTATLPGRIVLSFAPAQEPTALAAAVAYTSGFALSASRWTQLDARLTQIAEPRVPTAVSSAALPDGAAHQAHPGTS